MEGNIQKDQAVLDALERHLRQSSRILGILSEIIRGLPKPGFFSSAEYNRTFSKLESLADIMRIDYDKTREVVKLTQNTILCNRVIADKMDRLLNTEDDEICLDA